MTRLPRWLRRPVWADPAMVDAARELYGAAPLTIDTIVGAPRMVDGLDDDEAIVVGVLTTLPEGLHQPGDLARLIVAALRRGHP